MKGSKWGKCLKAPIRALCSVRDLYIKGMNNCAVRAQSGSGSGAMGYYLTLSDQYSHGYSFNSARSSTSDEDLRELIRAASVSKMRAAALAEAAAVRRSQSVVVGRIDEDEPCEFKEDVKVGEDLLFPRSQSYAVGMKRRMKVFAS